MIHDPRQIISHAL